ncbi:uncharacterized protein CLUP02_17378 [Colletotrichum lupini]|uniref:Uncharacterized protein n=1 Tax=Colletotrichum lupini TaxID=145971 RepID=A0A9Q8SEM6_9PEZI|nr:uncharacterized protein CLUP02_17378 [Colletotrichum lupini]UQC75869.1 hypothetical protein CLUP02_17378 [Colletotrichum lupini]
MAFTPHFNDDNNHGLPSPSPRISAAVLNMWTKIHTRIAHQVFLASGHHGLPLIDWGGTTADPGYPYTFFLKPLPLLPPASPSCPRILVKEDGLQFTTPSRPHAAARQQSDMVDQFMSYTSALRKLINGLPDSERLSYCFIVNLVMGSRITGPEGDQTRGKRLDLLPLHSNKETLFLPGFDPESFRLFQSTSRRHVPPIERQTDEAAQSRIHHSPCHTSMRLFFFSASSLYFLEYLNLPPVSYSSITAPTLPTPLCITSLVPPTTLPPLPSRPFLPWFLFRPASIITGYVFRVSRARPGRDNSFHAMTRLAEELYLAPLPTNRSHVFADPKNDTRLTEGLPDLITITSVSGPLCLNLPLTHRTEDLVLWR